MKVRIGDKYYTVKEVREGIWVFRSEEGKIYEVSHNSCSCPHFFYRAKTCKHMMFVKSRFPERFPESKGKIKKKENREDVKKVKEEMKRLVSSVSQYAHFDEEGEDKVIIVVPGVEYTYALIQELSRRSREVKVRRIVGGREVEGVYKGVQFQVIVIKL